MNKGAVRKAPLGYTIVEVMIFLAVTGLLFAMIALTFSGQRGRTQFQTAAREIESRARDIINDTSSGYYTRTQDFSCRADSNGPDLSSTPAEGGQGSNQGCIFIGRVAQFNAGDANSYNVYTVAGLRLESNTDIQVTNFAEAKPEAIARGGPSGSDVDITEELQLPNGAEVASMYYIDGGPEMFVDAVGFFSTFASFEGGRLQPGSLSVNVIPLDSGGDILRAIHDLRTASIVTNPSGGVTICINSGTSDQHAVLTIGGAEGGPLTVDTTIKNGTVSSGGTCHEGS